MAKVVRHTSRAAVACSAEGAIARLATSPTKLTSPNQSSFKALNIESDDESDDEIDNTKEIQIEEALKLYQTALKLLSFDKTLDQAGAAFEELFKSDIFKLAEAQSEYARVVAWESQQDGLDPYAGPLVHEAVTVQPPTENAPSTLPQVLHLSYKNRGEYHLSKLRQKLKRAADDESDSKSDVVQHNDSVRHDVLDAIKDFAEALDKDEDDMDLWRRTAKTAETLGSQRTARYCIETALQDNEDSLEEVINIPSFEANFDQDKLGKIHVRIQDHASMLEHNQPQEKKRTVPDALRRQLEPYQFLPAAIVSSPPSAENSNKRTLLKVPERSLDAIGACLLQQLRLEHTASEPSSTPPGASVELELPEPEIRPLGPVRGKSHDSKRAPSTTDSIASASREQSTVVEQVVTTTIPLRDSPISSRRASTTSPSLARSELPGRKRSTDVAGMPDTPDGERGRSKRIRTRKSTGGPGLGIDASAGGTDAGQDVKNETTLQADRWLFDLMRDVFRRMDVKMLCDADQLRKIVATNSPPALGEGPIKIGRAMQDLYQAMLSWNPRKTENFLQTKKTASNDMDNTTNAGLLAFLDSSSGRSAKPSNPVTIWADVEPFSQHINESWLTVEQAAVAWLQTMLSPVAPFASDDEDSRQSHYISRQWTEELKSIVEQLLQLLDVPLTKLLARPVGSDSTPQFRATFETAETIFEMHLDSYLAMTGPTADADEATQLAQKARLSRWFQIAWETLGWYTHRLEQDSGTEVDPAAAVKEDSLLMRHMWAAVFHLKAVDDVSREHLLSCINDAKRQIGPRTKPFYLSNNAAMPEISAAAADREISKLETMDFFLSIFNEENLHPVDLVERLEPILMPTLNPSHRSKRSRKRGDHGIDERSDHTDSSSSPELRDSKHELLSEFVSKATPAFRLSLWYRLRDAYQSIEFHPKVLLLNFRIIAAIVNELQSSQYTELPVEERERTLLNWMHEIHELLIKCYTLMHTTSEKKPPIAGLHELEFEQMRQSASCMIAVFTVLHTVALYDDYATALQKGPPLTNPFKAYPSESFHAAALRFHEMKLRTIIILYRAIEEAAEHYPDRPDEQKYIDQYEFLTYIHYELGVRRICKASDNMFLTFMRRQLTKLQNSQPISRDLSQVLYDLYDLNCFASAAEKEDHGCEPDYLDRETALDLVDFVLERTRATNMKDLPKVDLGKSVEKVQSALGPVKSTHATARNRKMINSYLKTAINPVELFQCLKGLSSLSTVPVPSDDAPIAAKGWYFLMAQINLAKHRRVRGQQAAPEEDLETAVTYLGHELEYDAEKWEPWYRLAYANDCLIEESVLWSAEKLNTGVSELSTMQRASIHSYAQAVAVAQRSADTSADTRTKLADLHAEFATRMFASTRPPFGGEAFSLRDFPLRHFSGQHAGVGTYTLPVFRALSTLQAYKTAIALLRRAIVLQPDVWQHRFMLGKCYWRAHLHEKTRYGSTRRILADKAFACFERVVAMLPPRKESSKQEPILEPLYKVVFVILKMVDHGATTWKAASEQIVTHLAKQNQFDAGDIAPLTEDEPSKETWLDFQIAVFKTLRAADKAKWHHRLHYKMASLIYTRHGETKEAAIKARDFMLEEKLFSPKTLALTVWKPENERPGRHWVYMTRYARFVTRVLEAAADLESMQLLARRVRKKSNEYFEHNALWASVLAAHLRLHRAAYAVPGAPDDAHMRNLTHDDFRPRAEAVDRWCSDPATTHPLLDLLREAAELKKLNVALADPTPIDDLLVDVYTQIYTTIGPTLPITSDKLAVAPSATATGTPEPQSTTAAPTPEKKSLDALATDDPSTRRPTPQPDGTAAPAHRPRPRAITRINILKRATEAAMTKAAAAPTAPSTRGGAAPEARVPSAAARDDDPDHDPDSYPYPEAEGDADDGDASSELSDLDSDVANEGAAGAVAGESSVEGTPRKGKAAGGREDGGEESDADGDGDGDVIMGGVTAE